MTSNIYLNNQCDKDTSRLVPNSEQADKNGPRLMFDREEARQMLARPQGWWSRFLKRPGAESLRAISRQPISRGEDMPKPKEDKDRMEHIIDDGPVVTGAERHLLLSEIQKTIRSYGWQSAAARLLAIGSVPLFLILGQNGNPLWKAMPVVCLFLLWIMDGHWKELQKRYIIVFHDAVHRGRPPDLDIQLHETYNVGALWRPMMALTYILLIGMFAVIGLR